ncbi:sortase B [Butyrivibrio sp. ob235]|nr:sortase B [Butyrivibrio sp. ob235]
MENTNTEKKTNSFWSILRIVLILILLGVIIYEGVMIYFDQKEYSVAISEYDNIADQYVIVKDDNSELFEKIDEDSEDEYPRLDINFEALKGINSDFIGWLYFPAISTINYPVVKEQSIDQYLHKTFEGTPNKAGCIFMDVDSDADFCGLSDFLFGHNMRNGSMFGSLKTIYKNKDKDILAENPYVYIYTEDKIYKYKVFSYYATTVGSYSYTEVKNESEYEDFVNYVKNCSMKEIPREVDFSEHPSLLTLSTCSGQSGSGNRFVVHSVKVASFDRQ